jgi:hypothetical protein
MFLSIPRASVTAASLLLLLPSAVCGCGYNSGFLHDASSGEYRLEVSSVRYVRTVSGDAQIGSLFCAIPLGSGLYKQAMDALLKDAHLAENEVLKSMRTDDDPSCFLIFGLRTLTVSADVYVVTPTDVASRAAAPLRASDASAAPIPVPHLDATRDYSQCNSAFDHVDQLAQLWATWFKPGAASTISSSSSYRATFNALCNDLDDETQLCLDVAYARGHRPRCDDKVKAIPAATRQQLDRVLLSAP